MTLAGARNLKNMNTNESFINLGQSLQSIKCLQEFKRGSGWKFYNTENE